MTVLGINGSPRDDGNTSYALRHGLELLAAAGVATDCIDLGGLDIAPCDGCFACRSGRCVHDDAMAAIVAAMRRSDGIILATPVYLGMPSGQMKVMMDRTVLFRSGGGFDLSGKVGAGIACGGFRNGGQELTLQCLHTYFLQQDMIVVADGQPFSHSGAALVGSAERDEVGLSTVENLAKRMMRAL